MTRQSAKELATGAGWVVAIFAGLIGLLSLVTGRSPTGDGSKGFVYKTVDGHELALSIYRPKSPTPEDPLPCVLWFFGGGWEVGSPQQFALQAAHLRDQGLVSITVDYRVRSRHGDTTPADAVKDARSAMRWVRAHAVEFGIDPDRIAAGGSSAGGHLAAGCALFDGLDEAADDPKISPVPNALILFNPVLDMDIPIVREKASGDQFRELQAISPVLALKGPLPPTLIIHGTADPIILIASVEAFVERARSLGGGQIDLVRYPGKTHEFFHHGLNGNRDFEETMDRVDQFLAEIGWLEK